MKYKIVTWNVFCNNNKIEKGLDFIFESKPDVVALQELPYKILRLLSEKHPQYHIYYTFDFLSNEMGKSSFLCLMTKHSLGKISIIQYSNDKAKSLLTGYYNFIGNIECHIAGKLSLFLGSKKVNICNTHFSAAASPDEKRKYFESVIRRLDENAVNIVLGDFNVNNGMVFPLITGFLRGYSINELFEDEHEKFDVLVKKHGYENVFFGKNTMNFPLIHQQLDHILVPNNIKYSNPGISESGYGSDHKILTLDIEV